MPAHHPDDSLLVEYATGALDEAKALLVATHLALCPGCRRAVQSGETAGAILAFGETTEAVAAGTLPDVSGEPVEAPLDAVLPPAASSVPEPLRDYLGAAVSDLDWRRVWPGMKSYTLPQFAGRARVRLLAISPGRSMPQHTHRGEELTLVLQGSFSDGSGTYASGDVATADPTIDHQPRAGLGELCICLAVEDAPLRVTNWLGAIADALR